MGEVDDLISALQGEAENIGIIIEASSMVLGYDEMLLIVIKAMMKEVYISADRQAEILREIAGKIK
jgi:hypothetical protein